MKWGDGSFTITHEGTGSYIVRYAPSYFDYQRGRAPKPLPDVVQPDFDPPGFNVTDGGAMVVEEHPTIERNGELYYECGEGYAHKVGTECRGQCVLRG